MKKILFTLLAVISATANAIGADSPAPDCNAYLFAYFEGRQGDRFNQEQLRFALSDNGVDWKALNFNRPVIGSDSISESGGIRDPHILRGVDGTFYIVATDMSTAANAWNANPGIVMLKSTDLINWTHSKVNVAKEFPKNFSDVFWVWAPQTIYDPEVGKYMIYFTLRRNDKNDPLTTYYAYANDDFTGFESEPKLLFKGKAECLDNDIVLGTDGKWHMFFKGHTKDKKGNVVKSGIRQAISKHLRGPWKESPDYVDAYQGNPPVEGSGIFKLNGSDQYVLMYDMYTSGKYEYQTSSDLVNFSMTPKQFTKDFDPRHGTVLPITSAEKAALEGKWGEKEAKNPILPGLHADPEIVYSNKTGKYYIYTTTDGTPGWGGYYFTVYSSPDLAEWTDEGIMLDVKSDQVVWANGNAWAPAIIERKEGDGYKYYFYFSANNPSVNRKAIGVAVSDSPTGPFVALDHPIVNKSPIGRGQQIDVDVFCDPVSGKYYLYWGNGYMAGAELNDDLLSIKEETVTVMTPQGGTLETYAYREAPYVFWRNGKYYFMWSVDDTGSPNYHVAYGTSDSPLGKIEVAEPCNILNQRPDKKIYGTAHNSVIQIPGTDKWRIVYHRINEDYIDKSKDPGIHRETCIDPLEFNSDGSIKPVEPTK